jgi:hypothetical protein
VDVAVDVAASLAMGVDGVGVVAVAVTAQVAHSSTVGVVAKVAVCILVAAAAAGGMVVVVVVVVVGLVMRRDLARITTSK